MAGRSLEFEGRAVPLGLAAGGILVGLGVRCSERTRLNGASAGPESFRFIGQLGDVTVFAKGPYHIGFWVLGSGDEPCQTFLDPHLQDFGYGTPGACDTTIEKGARRPPTRCSPTDGLSRGSSSRRKTV